MGLTLFGETFKWNIIGYDAAHGGLPVTEARFFMRRCGIYLGIAGHEAPILQGPGSLRAYV